MRHKKSLLDRPVAGPVLGMIFGVIAMLGGFYTVITGHTLSRPGDAGHFEGPLVQVVSVGVILFGAFIAYGAWEKLRRPGSQER